jgi:hypothetical protein
MMIGLGIAPARTKTTIRATTLVEYAQVSFQRVVNIQLSDDSCTNERRREGHARPIPPDGSDELPRTSVLFQALENGLGSFPGVGDGLHDRGWTAHIISSREDA